MQRLAQRGWRHGTGRILPVLAVALLVLGPAHAKDKKKKHQDADVPAQTTDAPAPAPDPRKPNAPAPGMREQPRAAQSVSLDRVISQVERRYKARVVSYKKIQRGDRTVYELRLLSDDGHVWNVRVDAETGSEV